MTGRGLLLITLLGIWREGGGLIWLEISDTKIPMSLSRDWKS